MTAATKPGVLAVMDAAIGDMEGPVRERRGHKWKLAEARATVEQMAKALEDIAYFTERKCRLEPIRVEWIDNRARAALAAFRGEAP